MQDISVSGAETPSSEIEVLNEAKIYKKEPLTEYQLRVNEEAGKIAMSHPELLCRGRRGVLLQKARSAVVDSGYAFKKGKSRSKKVSSYEIPLSRNKVNSEVRKKRIEELNEEIKNLDEQVVFKTKRREQKRNDAHRELCAF